jgi:hypothetical protein
VITQTKGFHLVRRLEGIVSQCERCESGIRSKCEEIFPLLCCHVERVLQGGSISSVCFAPHTMVIPESSQQLQDNALKEKLHGLAAYLTRR